MRGIGRASTVGGQAAALHLEGPLLGHNQALRPPCSGLPAAVDWLYWRFLEWVQPAGSIEPAPDFPGPRAAAGGARREPWLPGCSF